MIYTDRVHLIADELQELHWFAESIGMKRSWFQDHPKHPHYDIFGRNVTKAIRHGAKVVSSKKLIEILKNKMISKGQLYKDNMTGGKYRIIEVEKDSDHSILNIKIQNINNAGAIFDLGEWELKSNYSLVDSLSKAKLRG